MITLAIILLIFLIIGIFLGGNNFWEAFRKGGCGCITMIILEVVALSIIGIMIQNK